MDQRTNWTSDLESFPKGSVAESLIHTEAMWEPLLCLTEDPRWQLAQRVVASKSFSKSTLLSKFLLYVCDRALSGRTDEISENQIGVHVFVRKPGYNSGEDNIVRNYARQVRQRLDHYFEEEGKSEELRISIPLGKYIPVFSPNRSPELPPVPPQRKQEDERLSLTPAVSRVELPPVPPLPRKRSTRLLALFALLFVVVCGTAGWRVLKPIHSVQGDPCHPLWSQVFDKERQTFLVPSDDGIVMFQNLTGHSVHLAEYINRNYLSIKSPFKIDAQNLADLDAQRYTNIADLDAVLKFSRVPEVKPAQFIIRYARELHMEDLKDSNAILLGSTYSNPWVELFQKSLNFEFNYEPHPNASFIINKHPGAGESAIYTNDATAPSHRTYAVVALVPNLNNTGWILIVEGLTMAGTQAATDILFNREEMQSVLEKAAAGNGKLKPFELLIETRSFGSNSPQANIIANRIYSKLPTS
jgi:hypothetical protein